MTLQDKREREEEAIGEARTGELEAAEHEVGLDTLENEQAVLIAQLDVAEIDRVDTARVVEEVGKSLFSCVYLFICFYLFIKKKFFFNRHVTSTYFLSNLLLFAKLSRRAGKAVLNRYALGIRRLE